MEKDPSYEVAQAVRALCTVMARTTTDSTEVRIAKEVFRWSAVIAGAAVVAVAVL